MSEASHCRIFLPLCVPCSSLTPSLPLSVLSGFLLPSDAKDYQMFGYSVCIHNSTIAVGAYGDSSSGSNTGAVYIFRKTTQEAGSNSSDWMEVQKLSPRDPKSHANFGTSLDLSLSGISIYDSQGQDSYDLVVGASLATGSTSVTGAVYVFHSSSAATSLWTQYAKLYALDGTGDERFGSSVAIHGSFLAVGAPEDRSRGTDSGSAYVFELSPTERCACLPTYQPAYLPAYLPVYLISLVSNAFITHRQLPTCVSAVCVQPAGLFRGSSLEMTRNLTIISVLAVHCTRPHLS